MCSNHYRVTNKALSKSELKRLVNNQFRKPVTLVMAESESLENHRSACPMFLDILEGQLSLKIGDRVRFLEPGNCFYIPAGTLHTLTALEDSKLRITIHQTCRIVRSISLAS